MYFTKWQWLWFRHELRSSSRFCLLILSNQGRSVQLLDSKTVLPVFEWIFPVSTYCWRLHGRLEWRHDRLLLYVSLSMLWTIVLINPPVQRGPAATSKTLKAFPAGFRMLAGDPSKRNYTGDFAAQGVSFACLGANKPETNAIPNYNCPSGLRAQLFFPSCWVSEDLFYKDYRT
jgi:hypothetical protein